MHGLMLYNPPESNPKRKRRGKRSHKKVRRAKARRNPAPPRRRRHPARPKRHFRARRNPGAMVVGGVDVGRVGLGLVGAGTADVLGELAANALPATTTPGQKIAARYGFKVGLVAITSFGLGKFAGRTAGAAAGIGGLILIGMDAARQFLFPALKLPHGGLGGLGLTPEDLAHIPNAAALPVGLQGYVKDALMQQFRLTPTGRLATAGATGYDRAASRGRRGGMMARRLGG
jgi:hypothetical protein